MGFVWVVRRINFQVCILMSYFVISSLKSPPKVVWLEDLCPINRPQRLAREQGGFRLHTSDGLCSLCSLCSLWSAEIFPSLNKLMEQNLMDDKNLELRHNFNAIRRSLPFNLICQTSKEETLLHWDLTELKQSEFWQTEVFRTDLKIKNWQE